MALTDSDMAKLVEMLNRIDIRVKVRRKYAADWVSTNEVLLPGEWGKEIGTGKMKSGDGVTDWNSLPYFSDPSARQRGIQFRQEGSDLGSPGSADTVNFTGPGVFASRADDVVTVNVTSSGGGGSTSDLGLVSQISNLPLFY